MCCYFVGGHTNHKEFRYKRNTGFCWNRALSYTIWFVPLSTHGLAHSYRLLSTWAPGLSVPTPRTADTSGSPTSDVLSCAPLFSGRLSGWLAGAQQFNGGVGRQLSTHSSHALLHLGVLTTCYLNILNLRVTNPVIRPSQPCYKAIATRL